MILSRIQFVPDIFELLITLNVAAMYFATLISITDDIKHVAY
jgi:hypothetical protein